MERWGFEGLELLGKNLSTQPEETKQHIKKIKTALQGRSIKISAICGGYDGWLISDTKEIRDQAMSSIKTLLDIGGELGSTGLIVVPAFNPQPSLPHREARKLLTGFDRWDQRQERTPLPLLHELADYAARAGTRILLEPLARNECYFLRTLTDAASMCKDISGPGIGVLGDFWHMTWEETSDLGAFMTAGDYLHHVHIASRRRRKMPGEDGAADNYVLGFKGLKWIGYQDYISLECGNMGDKEIVIPAAAKLIREQWAQA